jgi:hypothetical protein
MRRGILVLVAATALVLTSGCQSFQFLTPGEKGPKKIKNSVKTVDNPVELKDVPIPEGFRYASDKSFRHHSNFKASRLYYERSSALTSLEDYVSFFESELPKLGWKVQFIYGKATRYVLAEKGGESCEIVLARKFRERRTIMVIKRTSDGPKPS